MKLMPMMMPVKSKHAQLDSTLSECVCVMRRGKGSARVALVIPSFPVLSKKKGVVKAVRDGKGNGNKVTCLCLVAKRVRTCLRCQNRKPHSQSYCSRGGQQMVGGVVVGVGQG